MNNPTQAVVKRQHEETEVSEVHGTLCRQFQAVCNRDGTAVGPLYIDLDGTWHRFYLDAGLLFWEEGLLPDEDDDLLDDEVYADWATELGVTGTKVSQVKMKDSELTIRFDNGASISLRRGPRDTDTSVTRMNSSSSTNNPK